jgi:hypothetical protein
MDGSKKCGGAPCSAGGGVSGGGGGMRPLGDLAGDLGGVFDGDRDAPRAGDHAVEP